MMSKSLQHILTLGESFLKKQAEIDGAWTIWDFIDFELWQKKGWSCKDTEEEFLMSDEDQ